MAPPPRPHTPHPLLALAAAAACVAVGVWLGRATAPPPTAAVAPPASSAVPVSYAPDARFDRTREELLRDVGVRLAALPPESRAKVEASLAGALLASALGAYTWKRTSADRGTGTTLTESSSSSVTTRGYVLPGLIVLVALGFGIYLYALAHRGIP